MPVARVTELSGTSEQSFEDAINQAINRATSTLRNVEGAHVKDSLNTLSSLSLAGKDLLRGWANRLTTFHT